MRAEASRNWFRRPSSQTNRCPMNPPTVFLSNLHYPAEKTLQGHGAVASQLSHAPASPYLTTSPTTQYGPGH